MHFQSNSNFRRGPKDTRMEVDASGLNGISKKLFESPFTTPKSSTQGRIGCSSTKGKKLTTGSTSVGAKRFRSVLPKGIKWNFPITSDMKLDLPELQAIAYVYHPDKDKSKRLARAMGIEATRADFDTLRPGHMVNHKIMSLVARRATWVQENYKRGTVWYLPPAFADDIFSGKSAYELANTYSKDWMPSNPKLKYIYIPINIAEDHWFLMVVSMQLGTIYHLDSHCNMGDVKPRKATISMIACALQDMFTTEFFGSTFPGRMLGLDEWPIEEARGIPNCGHSNNAAVWVIDWIDMDQCFTPNMQGELKENMVRVKTAAILVLGLQNDMWTFIEEESKTFWDLLLIK
ncbi:ubiquitin-specific protease ESD4 [Trifolium repens]|nr:ubiquitin-specific protease ESD4 [Trifolium repens]